FQKSLEETETNHRGYVLKEVNFVKCKFRFAEVAEMKSIVNSEVSHAYRLSGRLNAAIAAAEAAVTASREKLDDFEKLLEEGAAQYRLGLALSAAGEASKADRAFVRSLAIWRDFQRQCEDPADSPARSRRGAYRDLVGFVHYCRAQNFLWAEQIANAREQG